MAEWIPPKTNWVAGDIPGAGDFKRIEGNTEWLNQNKSGRIAKPGTYHTLVANTQRTTNSVDHVLLKAIRVQLAGWYKVYYEYRGQAPDQHVTAGYIRIA